MKTIKVGRHKRKDGTVVEGYKRRVNNGEADSLSDTIKRRKEEEKQREALFQFSKED